MQKSRRDEEKTILMGKNRVVSLCRPPPVALATAGTPRGTAADRGDEVPRRGESSR